MRALARAMASASLCPVTRSEMVEIPKRPTARMVSRTINERLITGAKPRFGLVRNEVASFMGSRDCRGLPCYERG